MIPIRGPQRRNCLIALSYRPEWKTSISKTRSNSWVCIAHIALNPDIDFLSKAKPDSAHHHTVLATLFKQPPRPSRAFIYDLEAELPEYAPLNETVQDHIAAIFHLHGAVDMEPPLLIPITDPEEAKNQATFIDKYGDIVALPNNILVAFARLAARGSIRRIKRYHITNVFRPKCDLYHLSL